MKSKKFQTGVLLLLLATVAVLGVKHQALQDWFRLHGYSPPQAVTQLAVDDTMTPKAQHVFYVNHPDITSGTTFTDNCPKGNEKTVVLGCYIGNDNGIYLYHVTDSQLQGVEQVTAAHEMLHAAYRRLSGSERNQVDAMLMNYYQHGLTDQRIKGTIAAYKKSEPNDVVNEMHSVFGTEANNLPPQLETYYKQYFSDRSKVVAYTASYEAAFTTREKRVAADEVQLNTYETQLKALKQQIDTDNALLAQKQSNLTNENAQLQAELRNGQVEAYNSGVSAYNQALDDYDSLVVQTNNVINQYNALLVTTKALLAERNSIVLEEEQLNKELSASPIPNK